VTVDVVALCRDRPSPAQVLAALHAACPGLRVRDTPDLLSLCDDHGVDRLHVDGPRLVQAPGEARRLLGVDVAEPTWWVEIRLRSGDARAATAARRFADALVVMTGGTTSCSR
jgi:hypothetical protein